MSRRCLSLKEKVELLQLEESKKCSVKDLMNKFKCGRSQVYALLKRKAEIFEEFQSGERNPTLKKKFRTNNDELNRQVWEWFVSTRSKGLPISGSLVQEQAKNIAEKLGNSAFKASNGWLDSFKKRHNIAWDTVSGEASNNMEQEDAEKNMPLSVLQNFFKSEQPFIEDYVAFDDDLQTCGIDMETTFIKNEEEEEEEQKEEGVAIEGNQSTCKNYEDALRLISEVEKFAAEKGNNDLYEKISVPKSIIQKEYLVEKFQRTQTLITSYFRRK